MQHVQLPIPIPKKGEVLVKVEFASVNPIDWKIQSGALKPIMPPKFPYIPGSHYDARKTVIFCTAQERCCPVVHNVVFSCLNMFDSSISKRFGG